MLRITKSTIETITQAAKSKKELCCKGEPVRSSVE